MSIFTKKQIDLVENDVREMSLEEKASIYEEIHAQQPNLFALTVAQTRMGVSLEKLEVVIEVFLICHLLSRNSMSSWKTASEAEIDKQIGRHTALVKFWDGLDGGMSGKAMKDYGKSYPEPELLIFGTQKLKNWLLTVHAEESDKYVMMVAMCIINCLAYGVRASVPNNSLQARRP